MLVRAQAGRWWEHTGRMLVAARAETTPTRGGSLLLDCLDGLDVQLYRADALLTLHHKAHPLACDVQLPRKGHLLWPGWEGVTPGCS